jgi:predicted naringenin-chalcone synthase
VAYSLFKKLDFTDGCIYCGLASVGAGVWQIYPPAALIVVGSAVFALGVAAIVVRGRKIKG